MKPVIYVLASLIFSQISLQVLHAEENKSLLEQGRYAIANAEQDKVEAQKAAYAKLSSQEREKRDKEANSLAAIGIVQFRAGSYEKAADNFKKSLELNPTNTNLYLQYGLSLFKKKEHRKGIFYVGWDTKTLPIAKYFHIGLAYFRLKDYPRMKSILQSVQQANDKRYSPKAAYYMGLTDFKDKNYESAKSQFEYVLDNSEDSELDQKAESYIEKILRAQKSKKKRSKRFRVNGVVGIQYDSNILFTPDGVADQGNSQGDGGARYLAGANASAKFLRAEKHEWALKLKTFYMKSPEERFQRNDPFVIGGSLPYDYRGKLFGKSFNLKLSPGYESLYLDANVDKERENILNSGFLNTSASFIMRKSWISKYELNVRSDDSKLAISNAADDLSAVKTQLFTTQTFILDKITSKTLGGKAGYTLNSADGDNNKYYRFDISGFFGMKLPFWKVSMINQLGYYQLNYTDRADDRTDKNLSVSATFVRPITNWVKASLKADYTNNDSNVAANKYDKWTAMAALSFDHAF